MFDIFEVNKLVRESYAEFVNTWIESSNSASKTIGWVSPLLGWLKTNIDVCIRDSDSLTSILVRDNRGSLVIIFSSIVHSTDPAVAEAATLLHGIKVVVDIGYNFVIFEGDCALVLNGLKGPIDLLGRDVSSLILNCHKMIKRIDMWDVSLVPRTADWEAHNLVK
ncbi:Ribonuclease H-like domain containing protein [Trema orientale]|uniref:Ribonuclease H-like domain containing protein n=1 Tax=Trema orientale TaxID=63057 RepID=A0A2P5BEY5_TREOI|nr:Ribonuclease H-like domain containing protein [Trema orientale]